MTDPGRAGLLRPVTCRWFEAAATGTIIIGQAPGNALFAQLLHPNLVVEIDPEAGKKEIFEKLGAIWQQRTNYQQAAYATGRELGEKLTWKNRVQQLLALL